jgi:hypothetical protein
MIRGRGKGRYSSTRSNAAQVTGLLFDLRDIHFCQQREIRNQRAALLAFLKDLPAGSRIGLAAAHHSKARAHRTTALGIGCYVRLATA